MAQEKILRYLNPDGIDGVTMLSGKKLVVRETPEEVLDRIVEYRRRIGAFKNEE